MFGSEIWPDGDAYAEPPPPELLEGWDGVEDLLGDGTFTKPPLLES